MSDVNYRPGLSPADPMLGRLEASLEGATRLELAVAYAKSSGVGRLLQATIPAGSRAVVGLGFGLTDPPAVEQLAAVGVSVRCVAATDALDATAFHPKLYLASRPSELVVLSGSANLTGGGLEHNVEQFEELRFADPSPQADTQRERFETLWDHGADLELLRRSGDWEEYRQRARDRRRLEQQDRRRVLQLNATTGRLIGQLARRETRRSPGYLAITHPDWWDLQLRLRDQADRALFWRRNTKEFKALAYGGIFFHLVRHPGGIEELRSVEGFSVYPGGFEVGTAESLWRRYGELLGVRHLEEVYDRLGVERGRMIGVIPLEAPTEFERPIPLVQLRESGISFQQNIVSGRGLTLEEVATILEFGGLGEAPIRRARAAESGESYGLEDEA